MIYHKTSCTTLKTTVTMTTNRPIPPRKITHSHAPQLSNHEWKSMLHWRCTVDKVAGPVGGLFFWFCFFFDVSPSSKMPFEYSQFNSIQTVHYVDQFHLSMNKMNEALHWMNKNSDKWWIWIMYVNMSMCVCVFVWLNDRCKGLFWAVMIVVCALSSLMSSII